MDKKNIKKNKWFTHKPKWVAGFTLVEAMVAISILSLSVLGTFTAVQSGLSKSGYAKEQVTAYYLIQETMEYIRNIRDQNKLQSIGGPAVDWLAGMSTLPSDPCYFGNFCYIDSANIIAPSLTSHIATCSNATDFNSCPYLKEDISTGLFGYGTGVTTKFKRVITFQSVGSLPYHESIVTIRIDWVSGAISKSIQVKEWIFDIR